MKEPGKARAEVEKELIELRQVISGLEHLEAGRKRTEEELALVRERLWCVQQALQQSEEVYRLVSALTSNFIFKLAVDSDGSMKTVLMTEEFQAIAGYDLDDLKNQGMWTEVVHPDDRPNVLAFFRSAARSGKQGEIENRVITKSGETRWLRVLIVPQWEEKSRRVTTITGAAKDITERKRAEAKIEELNADLRCRVEEIQATNKELEAFAHTLSHDLQTPLISIEAFSRRVAKGYSTSLDSKGQEYLRVVIENASRMRELVDDLLSFFKVERKNAEYRLVDMNKLCREAYEAVISTCPDRPIRLYVEKLPDAYGDRVMLREVFMNLFQNCVKFTRPRPTAEIGVGGNEEPEATVYYVKDNGIGFPQEQAKRLFQPFERLHSSNEFEGTGIGLAIVRRIIERHGGRVWAESKPDQGATFYFTIAKKKPTQAGVGEVTDG